MKNAITVLLILAFADLGSAEAKTSSPVAPTLACVPDGRKITLTITGDLTLLRADLPLPEKSAKICFVNGGRTGGSAKIADRLKLCREDKRDPRHKKVFGPMPILGRSFDRFAFRFLAGDKEYFMHGTRHFRIVGACRHVEDTEGFAITADPNAEQNKKTR